MLQIRLIAGGWSYGRPPESRGARRLVGSYHFLLPFSYCFWTSRSTPSSSEAEGRTAGFSSQHRRMMSAISFGHVEGMVGRRLFLAVCIMIWKSNPMKLYSPKGFSYEPLITRMAICRISFALTSHEPPTILYQVSRYHTFRCKKIQSTLPGHNTHKYL